MLSAAEVSPALLVSEAEELPEEPQAENAITAVSVKALSAALIDLFIFHASFLSLTMNHKLKIGYKPRLIISQIFCIVKELHKAGTTILLVEQNAQMALSVADRAYVLETGKIAMSGDATELLHDKRVQKAYLGG